MTAKPDATGTFACPICNSEAPHNHISEEVEAWRWSELASDADVLSMLDELQWSRAHYRAKAAVREVARRLARAKHDAVTLAVENVALASKMRLIGGEHG